MNRRRFLKAIAAVVLAPIAVCEAAARGSVPAIGAAATARVVQPLTVISADVLGTEIVIPSVEFARAFGDLLFRKIQQDLYDQITRECLIKGAAPC